MADAQASRTLGQALREGMTLLAAHGIETPAEDARRLLCHALAIDITRLIVDAQRLLNAAEIDAVSRVLAERIGGKPVSRIEGGRWFFGRHFHLNAATLDPRADSEAIVERALAVAGDRGFVLDIGTGSGCLLLSVLGERPGFQGLGIDIAAEAVDAAAANARRLGLSARATFAVADGLAGACSALQRQALPPVTLLLANPPYIPTAEIETLAPEVRFHDPRVALDGGADGLDHYRRLFIAFDGAAARACLAPCAVVVIECGHDQAHALMRMAAESSSVQRSSVQLIKDLGHRDRGTSFKLNEFT